MAERIALKDMQQSIKNRFSAKLIKYTRRSRLNGAIKVNNLPENKARKSVLRILLIGTFLVVSLFFILLLASYFGGGNTQVKYRLVFNSFALLYIVGAYVLFRYGRHSISSLLLLVLYGAFAAIAAWQWSINLPFATLLMCITITLAGILLGARFSLYAAASLSATLIILQVLTTSKIHTADVSWQNGMQSLPGDVFGYCLIFAILSLVSWIFGSQVERSLKEARSAKKALLKEKALLATRVRERTEKLRDAQLKEAQQLYRFAELGQLSTALLHDLANHLTTLNLDIEDIESSGRSDAIKHAKESMSYLDELVAKVSRQINDSTLVKSFNCLDSLQQLSVSLKTKLAENQVSLKITSRGPHKYFETRGDPIRFSQVIAILIGNAIDASSGNNAKKRLVHVQLLANVKEINIKIKDWGKGITPKEKNRLFQPFYSTKSDGMGLGLFIARQIVTTHFKGSIRLEEYEKPTLFKVTIPNREIHVRTRNSSKTRSRRTPKVSA